MLRYLATAVRSPCPCSWVWACLSLSTFLLIFKHFFQSVGEMEVDKTCCTDLAIYPQSPKPTCASELVPTGHELESLGRKKHQLKHCLPPIGPQSHLCAVFLIVEWCKRSQPTPGQVVLGIIRKQTERVISSKQCSSTASLQFLPPWLSSMMDCDVAK